MRQGGISFICVLGLFAALANAQQSKPNLSGKWQLNSSKSEVHSGKTSAISLIIEQSGASIHVVRTSNTSDGKQTVRDFKGAQQTGRTAMPRGRRSRCGMTVLR